jgi:signal transduction histidine kinase
VARAGRDSDVWPVLLLLFAVLAPAVCLLWFMSAAMRNERFAARQTLEVAYRGQLASARARLVKHWQETLESLERLAQTNSASTAFARCVTSGSVASVVLFDPPGRVIYPNAPSGLDAAVREMEPQWTEAGQWEYLRKDFVAAASRYDALATAATDVAVAARAWQAKARCLVQAGQKDAAVRVVNQVLGRALYDRAGDPQGRLIAANAELMVLELTTNHAEFQSAAQRLQRRLTDYENPVLAAPQRRFLMKELQALSPERAEFPTLAAEELAARWCEDHPVADLDSPPRATSIAGVWQFPTPHRRVLALVQLQKFQAQMQAVLAADRLALAGEMTLLPPGTESVGAFVSLPVVPGLPGWRLALSLDEEKLFARTTATRTAVYLWTGILAMGAMGVLTLLAIRLLRRQAALAQMKSDLVATVSHELKTPLSSMRVLVDTLLDSDQTNGPTVREYLQLIAQENERLSRLIENFLTFSRMERRKYNFHFQPMSARRIVDAAVEAVGQRLAAPDCRFEVQVAPDLPNVVADPEAMPTALINLLDNAWKYSEEAKHITLRARAENGSVAFSVQDNGIGIAPRETKKIFQTFYQADQRLSRQGGGCGLGLSIVQFIVSAHHGRVSVESVPHGGSTFTILLPAATPGNCPGKEATA